MKLNKKILIGFTLPFFVLAGLFSFAFSSVAANKEVYFSAYVVNNEDKQIPNGDYKIRFAIYTSDRTEPDAYPSDTDSDKKIWEETKTISIYNSMLATYLGANAPLPDRFDFQNNDYYLGVRINADNEMVPRRKIASVISAIDSSFVNGRTPGEKQGDLLVLGAGGKIDSKFLPLDQFGNIASAGGYKGISAGPLNVGFTVSGGQNSRTLTVTGNTIINQNLTTTSTPTFAGLNLPGFKGILKIINGKVSDGATTDDIPEGVNLYWTQSRFDEAYTQRGGSRTVFIGGGGGGTIVNSTSDVPEGSRLYWTDARFDARANSVYHLFANGANLGIGTTTADELLVVDGRVVIGQSTVPTTTADKLYNISGDLWWNGFNISSSSGGSLPSGSAGQTLRNNGSGWVVSSLFYNDGTGVAIGTTTVSSMFTVGTASGSQFLVNNAGAITAGTWQGNLIGVAYGGTGTSTIASIGKFLTYNGSYIESSNYGYSDFMIASNNLSDLTSSSSARTNLGLDDFYNFGINSTGTVGWLWQSDGDGRGQWVATSTLGLGAGSSTESMMVGKTTATFNGSFASSSFVGYQAGNYICNAQFADSHMCSTIEILNTINYDDISLFAGSAWIAEGPPGYTSSSNDCNGYSTSTSLYLGAFWLFDPNGGGAGWLSPCNMTKPISCCKK